MTPSVRAKLEALGERHQEIALLLAQPEVIDNPARFRELSREYAQLEPVANSLKRYDDIVAALRAAQALLADPEMRELAQNEVTELESNRAAIESELNVLLLPRDPRDDANLFLEIRAGTGGDEAAIFAGDLLRMYLRYAESRRWKVDILSESPGEHGGYREIVARIEGKGAFSRLKFESGTHRVQRVPITESQGRIHTSAATVAILPETDEIEDIELRDADLKVDTFRASGAGGQHVNKTDSAVRLTHLPTNIVAQCQNERSQHKNKAMAMKILRAKLFERERLEKRKKLEELTGEKREIGFGSQIRSYTLHPQQRAKDHRTDLEIGNVEGVLDGDIDAFIRGTLLFQGGQVRPQSEKE